MPNRNLVLVRAVGKQVSEKGRTSEIDLVRVKPRIGRVRREHRVTGMVKRGWDLGSGLSPRPTELPARHHYFELIHLVAVGYSGVVAHERAETKIGHVPAEPGPGGAHDRRQFIDPVRRVIS